MQSKTQISRTKSKPSPYAKTFDVTCVIGTVAIDPFGEESADVVAMKLIAEHGAPGRFTFPMADGRMQAVTVEFVDPADMMREDA